MQFSPEPPRTLIEGQPLAVATFCCQELVSMNLFGVSYFRIVNAAFCQAHPLGSRFNGPDRRAWFAGFDSRPRKPRSHITRRSSLLNSTGSARKMRRLFRWFQVRNSTISVMQKNLAHVCVPSRLASQDLAQQLPNDALFGVIHPSVRYRSWHASHGLALVNNVPKGPTYKFKWKGRAEPEISLI